MLSNLYIVQPSAAVVLGGKPTQRDYRGSPTTKNQALDLHSIMRVPVGLDTPTTYCYSSFSSL